MEIGSLHGHRNQIYGIWNVAIVVENSVLIVDAKKENNRRTSIVAAKDLSLSPPSRVKFLG
jgi:hypothetical protein